MQRTGESLRGLHGPLLTKSHKQVALTLTLPGFCSSFYEINESAAKNAQRLVGRQGELDDVQPLGGGWLEFDPLKSSG